MLECYITLKLNGVGTSVDTSTISILFYCPSIKNIILLYGHLVFGIFKIYTLITMV